MKGLELSKKYFEAYGKEMLAQFPTLLPYLAVGLVGEGSECFGFDDEISEDHDFEPGFCIFLPGEEIVSRRDAFLLEKAYLKLPRDFEGYHKSLVNPVGGARHGIFRTDEFYEKQIGSNRAPEIYEEWKQLPEYARAQATNGQIFFDNYGEFSKTRTTLSKLPDDVLKKRLAGYLLLAGQSGQYNYPRILKHRETEAAQFALFSFAKAVLRIGFLLNEQPMPYYKWSFRAFRALETLSDVSDDLSYLITHNNTETEQEIKSEKIDKIVTKIVTVLNAKGLSALATKELELQAYEVNKQIQDAGIRNLHILDAVESEN